MTEQTAQTVISQIKELVSNVVQVKSCTSDIVKQTKRLKKLDPETVRELGQHVDKFGEGCTKLADIIGSLKAGE